MESRSVVEKSKRGKEKGLLRVTVKLWGDGVVAVLIMVMISWMYKSKLIKLNACSVVC